VPIEHISAFRKKLKNTRITFFDASTFVKKKRRAGVVYSSSPRGVGSSSFTPGPSSDPFDPEDAGKDK
jgi:hypothetical protein